MLCVANIAYNFIWAGIAIHILTWPDFFNPNFLGFIERYTGDVSIQSYVNDNGTVIFLPAAIAIIIIFAVIDIVIGVRNTLKGMGRV